MNLQNDRIAGLLLRLQWFAGLLNLIVIFARAHYFFMFVNVRYFMLSVLIIGFVFNYSALRRKEIILFKWRMFIVVMNTLLVFAVSFHHFSSFDSWIGASNVLMGSFVAAVEYRLSALHKISRISQKCSSDIQYYLTAIVSRLSHSMHRQNVLFIVKAVPTQVISWCLLSYIFLSLHLGIAVRCLVDCKFMPPPTFLEILVEYISAIILVYVPTFSSICLGMWLAKSHALQSPFTSLALLSLIALATIITVSLIYFSPLYLYGNLIAILTIWLLPSVRKSLILQ